MSWYGCGLRISLIDQQSFIVASIGHVQLIIGWTYKSAMGNISSPVAYTSGDLCGYKQGYQDPEKVPR